MESGTSTPTSQWTERFARTAQNSHSGQKPSIVALGPSLSRIALGYWRMAQTIAEGKEAVLEHLEKEAL